MQGDVKSKPILFNTAMVQAILDGRKTVTRRVVKPHREAIIENVWLDKEDGEVVVVYNDNNHIGEKGYIKPKYQVGDVIWVRETWQRMKPLYGNRYFVYKADIPRAVMPWRPSIHMPREAARILLKVTDVRVERLQDMKTDDVIKEGVYDENELHYYGAAKTELAFDFWVDVWNSTIKKKDLPEFGWDANPWVWVVEFERFENAV